MGGVPKLWSRFRGYGFNKLSWFLQLDRAGYKFAVLRDYFVTHIGHPSHKDNVIWESNKVHWLALLKELKKNETGIGNRTSGVEFISTSNGQCKADGARNGEGSDR